MSKLVATSKPGIERAMGAKVELKVQNWGNNLAVRIPAPVARAARLVSGQQVTVEAIDGQIVVTPQDDPPRMTLEQMVKAFDPKVHGGELMADPPPGHGISVMVKRWVPDRCDIIWIDFDPQASREMKARHPMLVLSPRLVNDPTSIVIGLPMSTQDYNATNPFAVALHADDGTTGYIITNQPKSFDWRLRKAKAHPWKRAPADVFDTACDKLNRIITICAG